MVDVLFYTQCGGWLVWWMPGVVDVCCGGCPILLMVWWISGVVDVCVVDVVQSNPRRSAKDKDARTATTLTGEQTK